ncbi:MAG: hypothetical protein KAU50_04795 [Candidatus Marinimicrobia bacterium]|nr:hypothetical protein [Candidatus Neomarinimicrobiota bacterium]
MLLLAFLDGTYLFRHYLKPWEPYSYQQFDDDRLKVIAHGILGYSRYNVQPWKVVFRSNDTTSFYLHVDTTRAFPYTDPYARRGTFAQGTFIEHVVNGAGHMALEARVELFPQGEYDIEGRHIDLSRLPAARITIVPGESSDNTLYLGMFKTATSLRPFDDTPVPTRLEHFFNRLNDDRELRIQVISDREQRRTISRIASEAAEVERTLPDSLFEHRIFRVNEHQKNEHRDGLTLDAFRPSFPMKFLWQSMRTVVPVGNRSGRLKVLNALVKSAETAPAFLLVSSRGNGRLAQLKAGMLFARIQMAAAQMGLTIQPLTQVLGSYPEIFESYIDLQRQFAIRGFSTQMLAAIGTQQGEIALAPRRNPADLVQFVKIKKPKKPKPPRPAFTPTRSAETPDTLRTRPRRRKLPSKYKTVPR